MSAVDSNYIVLQFDSRKNQGFTLNRMEAVDAKKKVTLRPDMTSEEIRAQLKPTGLDSMGDFSKGDAEWKVIRNRCFLNLNLTEQHQINEGEKSSSTFKTNINISFVEWLERQIEQIIHLPGLRGNPDRAYPVAAVNQIFPGTFENYTASVIAHWQQERDAGKLERLIHDLKRLGLACNISAVPINDTQVELQVSRMLTNNTKRSDMVSIADVGFSVSQTLPVLVALQVAVKGQLIYIEQPEIHLHPRAQTALAEVLADAAKRGVRVIAETHSSLLILGIQTLVAEGKLSPDLVKLHWFTRRDDGSTEITSSDLDEAGAFGDWPEDFADVELKAESRYLDAAEQKLVRH